MLVPLAAVLLSLAVAGGVILSALNVRRVRVPLVAGLVHAGTAIAGIALLMIGVVTSNQPVAVNAALLLFAIALVGGVFVLLFRLQPARPPLFMIALHGATAIAGLAVLWVGILAAG